MIKMDCIHLVYVGKRMVSRHAGPLTEREIEDVSSRYNAKLAEGHVNPWGNGAVAVYNFEPRTVEKERRTS